jgi:hypothetical protein
MGKDPKQPGAKSGMSRRNFIGTLGAGTLGAAVAGPATATPQEAQSAGGQVGRYARLSKRATRCSKSCVISWS